MAQKILSCKFSIGPKIKKDSVLSDCKSIDVILSSDLSHF